MNLDIYFMWVKLDYWFLKLKSFKTSFVDNSNLKAFVFINDI